MNKKARKKILEKLAQDQLKEKDGDENNLDSTDTTYSDLYLKQFLANWQIKGLDF